MTRQDIYSSPALRELRLGNDILLTSVNGGSWDRSLDGAGSKWGGLDTDDSTFGL